ncbi:uncharacterized protein LOC135695823 isoform X2 [Rhopilema esculentum]|uniref:uncharacterized protein LOC135695823 isoform X2 n=1 Tax=Rhopilema esculentum TaxID=499914 RepID=UPI0031D501AF
MDWRVVFCLGSYFILLTGFSSIDGHPVRRHNKKTHTLTRKAKIVTLPKDGEKSKQKKSSFYPGRPAPNLATTEDAKKKGTIRISGPWHSDSGLDRNVDPMEDSYVKKIISTNEGLNFNKDMAEAGEVFDVNGIEDFYDRNALITYEVNGHEIPVHMKQKLTPQSQPMFPEYGHDSPVPEATSSRTGHAYNHRRPGTHRATTFYGMSLKDMPEYKVRDTPSLGERRHSARFFEGKSHTNGQQVGDDNTFSSRHRLGNAYRPGMYDSSTPSMQRAADPQSQIEKFSSEYEQANQFGQEDAALGSRFQSASMPHFESDKQVQAPDSSVAGLRAHSLFNRLHNNEGTLSSDEGTSNGDLNERLKEFVNQARHKNQEQLLEELARLKLQKAPSLFEKPSHVEETFQKHPSEPSKFSEKLTPALGANAPVEEFSKAHRVSSFFGKSNSENEESAKSAEVGLTGDNRGIGKEYDGTKLAPDAVQPSKEKEEPKEEIDYKGPSYEDKSRFSSDSGGEMKDHVHLSKYGSDQPSIERPIISSFYGARDSKPSDELDVHSFHNEVNASPEHEVTPTQRDGGKQRQKDTEKLAESEKKPIVQLHSESESKSDPDDDLPDYNEVKDAAIFEENFIRKKFHAPNLRWSDDLSDEAQKEADDLADENSLDLGKKSVPKGMNVALVPVNSLNVGKDSADLWQKESTKFDFVSPYVSKKNSDFAQMVWKTAKEFGLGVAKARNKENWIVVAKYDTPVVSEFEKLKANIESDIPIADPYSDIARRERILSIKDRN